MCDLECDVDKEFTSSVDSTPQICIDGQWSYEQMQVPFPTCEGLERNMPTIMYVLYNTIWSVYTTFLTFYRAVRFFAG